MTTAMSNPEIMGLVRHLHDSAVRTLEQINCNALLGQNYVLRWPLGGCFNRTLRRVTRAHDATRLTLDAATLLAQHVTNGADQHPVPTPLGTALVDELPIILVTRNQLSKTAGDLGILQAFYDSPHELARDQSRLLATLTDLDAGKDWSGRPHSVHIALPRSLAAEILGREPDPEEWLEPEDSVA